MPNRARIPDVRLASYEDVIAAAIDVLHQIEPVLRRAIDRQDSDDIQALLLASLAANFIRQDTISNMHKDKNGNGG